jgi:catechol 2,3-dioxygenase-like lactoylglutathione lyase family enzyme
MGYDLPMRVSAIFILPLLALTASAQTLGMNNWIHATADLDKTVQFYIDAFGLAKPAPPRPPNPAVPGLLNVPGAKLHVQILRFPGSPYGFELTNFGSDIALHPGQPHPWDPGAGRLIVRVRDLDLALAALEKAGAQMVTHSKAPVKIAGTPSVMVRDPDGYLLEVQAAPGSSSGTGNVVGTVMGLTAGDMQATVKFYHDFLGFDLTGKMEFASDHVMLDLVGAPPGVQYRSMSAIVPGTKSELQFTEFKGVDRKTFRHQVPDPGTPAIALRVTDLDGLLARLKAAKTPVISAGGVPAQFGANIRNIFVEDPNGFKIELYEQK